MQSKDIVITILGILVVVSGVCVFQQRGGESNARDRQHQGEAQNKQQFTHGERQRNMQLNRDNCSADECVQVSASTTDIKSLPQDVSDALGEAIDDEYKALATYQAIMGEFGRQRPFSMIARSEQMHIALLKSVYEKYGLEIPENPYVGSMEAPESVRQACENGVQAEIANAELYEKELLPAVEGTYPDITRAFERLMNASQERHLQAFRRCS